ncbi:uncharacterized protein PAE49_021008 isoform 1-T2 [Odontesthes bonariensis]|uniref:uncharacterized protein LOC142369025 n=1 Tax=Odontesthes bonariensis TaxID=219752 RepID=UPI003F58C667
MHVMGSVSLANESERLSFQEEDVAIAVAMLPPSPSTFSEIKETQTRLSDPPPPPPPPIPPPPPPPLLPLAPGLGDPTVGLKKKRRVRSFFWKTIPVEQVKGRANLWTQGQVQQHFQIDVQKIEELFGQNDRRGDASATGGGRTRASFREIKEEVSILDSKRAMNIAIFLKQFKRSNQVIVDDIHRGNSVSFGAEPLRELLKLLPEAEEAKKLKAYPGDSSKLPLADSFMHLLIQVPSYSVRIESMLLKEEFHAACEAMKQDIKILRSATKELMCCEELHAVLHLVLQAGNILNAGGYAGNAVGFKLSSLLSLADTKANKPGMNLLHFVALEAQKKDEKLLQFPLKLSDVQAASRIPLETLDADLQLLTSRTCSVEENIQKDTELLQQLDSFLQSATLSLRSLQGGRQQLKKEGSELIDFFCEDRDTFRLDECFRIFHSFCTRFSQAVKENTEREVKEAARRQRLQEEEQKRHSWAGGEKVGGAFGLRCSSETDMSAIMSLRHEAGLSVELPVLKSRPRSPLNNYHSPRGRSWSQQRTRYSPSNSPSVAAERELSNLLEMSSDHKVVRQRGSGDARAAFPPASSKQTLSKPPETPENTNRTTADLSSDDAQTQMNVFNNASKVTVEATSHSDQRADHSDSGNAQLGLGFSSQATLLHPQTYSGSSRETDGTNNAGEVFSPQIGCTDEKVELTTATKGNMSVVLEKRTLVPELKAFDKVTALSSHQEVRCIRHPQQDLVITDLEGGAGDASQEQKVQNNSQETENEEKPDVHDTRSSSQREENEEEEDKVIVWCVTGVCEAAGESAQTDQDLCGGDGQGGKPKTSTASANQSPSEPQPASEKSVPLPISSQPVPCKDSSLPASSPRMHQSASVGGAPASEEDQEPAGQGKEEEADQRSTAAPVPGATRVTSHQTTKDVSSSDGKAKPSPSSRLSTKNSLTSKPRVSGVKPSAPNRSKSVRTLTNSESQDLRRVVPITKTSRGAPPTHKQTERPSAQSRSSAKTPVPSGPTVSNLNSASLRRGARPATAPSSRRSSTNRMPDSKEPKEQKAPGIQGFVQEQKQDSQRKPSIRKALTKPKTQTEEKMCLSKLRALNQGGGGGSVSAPATPLHKAKIPATPLPGFARSTASSSFRRSNTTLAPSLSPESSPKDSFRSTPSTTASSAFTRTGSLRVSASSKSPDLLAVPSSSPLRRSQSIRSPARSPLRNPPASPKGHRRNDSGSFSDKSNQSRDSGKSTKPSWR